MPSSGPNNGSSFSSYGPGPFSTAAVWSNPSNATASDNSHATITPNGTGNFQYLVAWGFGFSVAGTINGLVAEVERKTDSGTVVDANVRLTKTGASGTGVGTDKADTGTSYPTSDTYASYGGSSDLWGTTWTDSEINSADFGLLFRPIVNSGSPVVSVDHIRITVHYTEAGVPRSQSIMLAILAQ